MKLDRLIFKKIIKIVATRCQILRLKCTKFDFAGELTAGFMGPTSNRREGKERREVYQGELSYF